jgi:DNA (cytosine-5)-methyltransferase 3A
MKVLSLFDGMSCTQIALKNLGIKVDTYYASEIDKYGIQIAKKNFPDTVHLGDVKDIKGKDLPEIDLIVAGSPCQGFSFAGKQLAFDDPRSALFFEFVRILKEVKPKYFLLENVRMKKEFQAVISEQISSIYPECTNGGLFGIEPILINSALVSAQNRNRLYWTNIPNIKQPKDIGLVLRDVLEDNFVADRDKSYCIDANYYKGGNPKNYFEKSRRQLVFDKEFNKMTTKDGKSYALTATYQGAVAWNSIERKQRTMIPTYDTPKKLYDIPREILKDNERQRRVYSKDGKSPTVLARSDSAKVETYDTPKQVGTAADLKGFDIIKRVYSENGKSPTLTTMGGGHREPKVAVKEEELTWRKLTPLECERLQTVPDNYTDGVSNTQRYKMLGNGFTVRVIEHILKNMNEKGE